MLAVHIGAAGATAVLLAGSDVVATGRRPVALRSPDALWRAVLGACGDALAGVARSAPSALALSARAGEVLLWDTETLGSPQTSLPGPDAPPAAALAHLVEHEPHTWALVESGRYALGTLDSYLVARMTRGTWHLTDPTHAACTGLLDVATGTWSAERCAAAHVPLDALPVVVPGLDTPATTDPSTFLGLTLPLVALLEDRSATTSPALLAALTAAAG